MIWKGDRNTRERGRGVGSHSAAYDVLRESMNGILGFTIRKNNINR